MVNMRRITAIYWVLVVVTVVQSTPMGQHPGGADGSMTGRDLPAAIRSIIDWYKRSLEGAYEFVINRIPNTVPMPSQENGISWHGGDDTILSEIPLVHTACINPSVRKEWRSLSVAQREAWINAVHCLARLPGSGKLAPTVNPVDPFDANPPVNRSASWYDDLSYVHMDLNTHVHQTGLFFPWHRYFLWSFELTLREQCGFSGVWPYWDWTRDVPNFKNSTILSDPDPKSGLGGFGDPNDGNHVRDGAFAGLQLAYPSPHTLQRKYTPYPYVNRTPPWYPDPSLAAGSTFAAEKINNVSSSFRGDFQAFQTYLEHMQGPHMGVHLIMGGDLGGSCPEGAPRECRNDAKWSPNEPMFWLHHGMLDKLWFDWQRAHPENFRAFEGGTIRDMLGWPRYTTGAPPAMTPDFRLPRNGILHGNYTVRDMFDTTSSAPLCYTYA